LHHGEADAFPAMLRGDGEGDFAGVARVVPVESKGADSLSFDGRNQQLLRAVDHHVPKPAGMIFGGDFGCIDGIPSGFGVIPPPEKTVGVLI